MFFFCSFVIVEIEFLRTTRFLHVKMYFLWEKLDLSTLY